MHKVCVKSDLHYNDVTIDMMVELQLAKEVITIIMQHNNVACYTEVTRPTTSIIIFVWWVDQVSSLAYYTRHVEILGTGQACYQWTYRDVLGNLWITCTPQKYSP